MEVQLQQLLHTCQELEHCIDVLGAEIELKQENINNLSFANKTLAQDLVEAHQENDGLRLQVEGKI
jgi:hypothetical protein